MKINQVLFISYDGLTDPLGQSQVLPYLIQLSKLNYEITILSTEKEDNFFRNKSTIQKICDDSNISWEFIMYTKTPPVLSTIKDVRNLKKKAKQLFNQKKIDVIHCRSYISALVGLWMKRKFGTKFLFDMRGFWADERVDGGIWDLNNPAFKTVYNFFKKKEKAYLLTADETVSLTYNGRDEIASWDYYPAKKKDRITVIPCCADLNHFDYNKYSKELSIKAGLGIPTENTVVCYLGSVGTWYMMDEMLDYFKVHLQRFPKSTFLWITKDAPELILETAREKGVEENIVIKPSERSELPGLLSICDASIFFIKPLFSKKASSPTKMAELLGMGIPLICNTNVGDTDGVVKKEQVGLVVNDFNEAEYTEVVNQFEELIKTPKSDLRSVAKQYFSLEEGVKNYAEIYSRLCD